ncbi:MAG: hypothetical protein K2H09_09085, partial [Treponemataceae bacterium]|nr:hypothetical protein [Treponemataceae bacterium]
MVQNWNAFFYLSYHFPNAIVICELLQFGQTIFNWGALMICCLLSSAYFELAERLGVPDELSENPQFP